MKIKTFGIIFFLLLFYFGFSLQKNIRFSLVIHNRNSNTIFNIPSISGNYIFEWDITWGSSEYDRGNGIAIDSLGNVYVTGYTGEFAGNGNVFLLKYNSNGNQLWNTTWGV